MINTAIHKECQVLAAACSQDATGTVNEHASVSESLEAEDEQR